MTFEIVFVLLSLLGMVSALFGSGFISVRRHSDSEGNA